MKILLIGNTGFIGNRLYGSLKEDFDVTGINSKVLDITNKDLLKDFLQENLYDLIILSAASKDVKKLEQEPEYAYKINTQPVETLVENTRSRIIFISTDYVFEGTKGYYKDNDKTSPATVYGKTKQQAEEILLNSKNPSTIIRTSAVIGKGSLFFDWLLKSLKEESTLEMFEDSYFTPTSVKFLCEIIKQVIQDNNAPKIIHACGEKRLSRFELAKVIREQINSDCKIIPVKNKYKDYSLVQSEYVQNLQKKSFEQYLKEELNDV